MTTKEDPYGIMGLEVEASDEDLAKAIELRDLWNSNEETMGEMAAYGVACAELGIGIDDGWSLLALIAED